MTVGPPIQGQRNDKRMQICVEKECQWKIIECPQCLSIGILVGLDQVQAPMCYDCLQQSKAQEKNTATYLKKKEAWEKVRPVSQEYPKRTELGNQEDLPYLQSGDRACTSPIMPVVTVKKNYYADKKLKQEIAIHCQYGRFCCE